MTLQHMMETVRQSFPVYGTTQVIVDLNRAYVEFCERTKVYELWEDLTTTTAMSYLLTAFTADPIQINAIQWLDSTGAEMEPDLDWITEGGKLLFYNPLDYTDVTYPTDITTTRVHLSARPAVLSSYAGEPVIPAEFHGALVDRVLQWCALRPQTKDIQLAREYERQWMDKVIEAKKYFNNQQSHGNVRVTGGEM